MDVSAKREVFEELGIDSTDPKFLFKTAYTDDVTSAWIHVYIQLHIDGSPLKPQESEIDALFFWTEDQIRDKIRSKAKITPDGVKIEEKSFFNFIPSFPPPLPTPLPTSHL